MINKKKLLGKQPLPEQLGEKDAVHQAIVAVRAYGPIEPGGQCDINEFNEAISTNGKGVGIADPFLKATLVSGDVFWLLIPSEKVDDVSHVWNHKKESFDPPTRDVEVNTYINDYATEWGLTYTQLMDALKARVTDERASVPYEGTLNAEELEQKIDECDSYDLWYEWCGETGYEFENIGSMCCPEYEFPALYGMFVLS